MFKSKIIVVFYSYYMWGGENGKQRKITKYNQ